MTPATVRQLQELRRQLPDPPATGDLRSQLDQTITAAACPRHQEPAAVADSPPEMGCHPKERLANFGLPEWGLCARQNAT